MRRKASPPVVELWYAITASPLRRSTAITGLSASPAGVMSCGCVEGSTPVWKSSVVADRQALTSWPLFNTAVRTSALAGDGELVGAEGMRAEAPVRGPDRPRSDRHRDLWG